MRESLAVIDAAGARAVGVAISLDRRERGTGERSAVQEIEQDLGLHVVSVATLDDLVELVEQDGSPADLERIVHRCLQKKPENRYNDTRDLVAELRSLQTTGETDAVVRRSIETAVYLASPLPTPSDPSVFDRDIRLTFRPEDED